MRPTAAFLAAVFTTSDVNASKKSNRGMVVIALGGVVNIAPDDAGGVIFHSPAPAGTEMLGTFDQSILPGAVGFAALACGAVTFRASRSAITRWSMALELAEFELNLAAALLLERYFAPFLAHELRRDAISARAVGPRPPDFLASGRTDPEAQQPGDE